MTPVKDTLWQTARNSSINVDTLSSFPLALTYRSLGRPPGRRVRESAEPDSFPYTERHLQCVWFDNSLRPPELRSPSGETVLVESPGRWNLEAGPDFLDASLIIGPDRRHVRGDVEVHVRPADWHAHSHAADPAYRRVIAHVSYFPGAIPADTLPPNALQLTLQAGLKARPSFSFESVDVTAYPYAALPASVPPCATLLAGWPPQDALALLDSAGQERLRVKACRMEAAIKDRGPRQAFYEEMMCALGYKQNRLPFRQLAAALPLDTLREEAGRDVIEAYALLLGAAGLLPAKPSTKWDAESRTFVRSLWDHWWKRQATWQSRCLPADSWRLSGLRPPNHPVRRLAAAAALFGGKRDLLADLRAIRTARSETWFKKASARLEAPVMEYWNRRLSLGGQRQNSDTALLGAGRIAAMLSNVVIPYLAASGEKVAPLLSDLPAEEDNNLIRQTAFALLGRDHNPALYHSGLRQQGLLQIFHDFCLTNRSACRDCELVRALESRC